MDKPIILTNLLFTKKKHYEKIPIVFDVCAVLHPMGGERARGTDRV